MHLLAHRCGLVALFFICLLSISFVQIAYAAKFALVIGNANYAQAPLKNPVNDARAMTLELARLGFKVTALENASKTEMEEAIVAFDGALSANATGLCYYAGHGVQVRGKNYLVPISATMALERHARVGGVDVGLVTSAMEYSRSRVNFFSLDACRNNPFERSSRSDSRGLAAVDAATGTLIADATAPGWLGRTRW